VSFNKIGPTKSVIAVVRDVTGTLHGGQFQDLASLFSDPTKVLKKTELTALLGEIKGLLQKLNSRCADGVRFAAMILMPVYSPFFRAAEEVAICPIAVLPTTMKCPLSVVDSSPFLLHMSSSSRSLWL
jgi:hypothetical protein